MTATDVHPYEVQPGDRMLGMPGFMVKTSYYQATGMLDGQVVNSEMIYGAAGAWRIEFTNGSSIVYGANRKVSVLRGY